MSIHILGTKRPEKFRVSCTSCHARLEYEKSDVRIESIYEVDTWVGGDVGSDQFLRCPKCKKEILLLRERKWVG